MSATELVNALEQSLIEEAEAISRGMVENLRDLYRAAILELAPHLADNAVEPERSAC